MAKKGKHAKHHAEPAAAAKSTPSEMGNTTTSPVAEAKSGGTASPNKSKSFPTTPISKIKSTTTSPSTSDIPKYAHDRDDNDEPVGKVESLAPKIERRLSSRPDAKDLDEHDIIHSLTIAPTIQSTAKKLQRRLSADHVSTLLNKRPSFGELADQGIVSDKVAPTLQATSESLKRQLTADRLNKHIHRRPSLQDLADQGVVDEANPTVAPSLIATAKKLERTMVQNQVGQLLETRPGLHDLVTQQIVADTTEVANALQGPMQSLSRHLKADELSRKLKSRKSFDELFPGRSKESNAVRRARYTIALKAAARIAADKLISSREKGRLKDLILSDDSRIVGAIKAYEDDRDVEEMLDTLYRIAKDKHRV
ncbi:hypothetical protein AeNC1_004246 [Aphanomyces euteiches]|nr:hypothetical protein AeNC1_004246 [Aphanomyces euteiches]